MDAAGARDALPRVLVAPADRPRGAPTVLYIGGEYCPFCAAGRRALITAPSYVQSRSVEAWSNIPLPAQPGQRPMQALSPGQRAIFTRIDTMPETSASGSIPVILAGGSYLFPATFPPGVPLAGMSARTIALQPGRRDEPGREVHRVQRQ